MTDIFVKNLTCSGIDRARRALSGDNLYFEKDKRPVELFWIFWISGFWQISGLPDNLAPRSAIARTNLDQNVYEGYHVN